MTATNSASDCPASENPLLTLAYEPAIERLGNDYYDIVTAAEFPTHLLRFRNDALLPLLGLDPALVSDANFIDAFGKFQGPHPFLALRYHGYQFGEYNPRLGDGRGFLYGQVRGADGHLYDLGTKGSGTTPYSRGGDGRLTLKGGMREVIAAEALYRAGVRTSRCLSLVETGEQLWRGDEPSPTRSSVMIRLQRSHIRFGTFERLHHLGRKDLIAILLDHVIEHYYPQFMGQGDRHARFYAELVQRVAELAAQWMSAGFCHAVLNTDNMSIAAESFDYGPYAFIESYNPRFTAAYFDYFGLYCYGNQPAICQQNLERLQRPLELVMSSSDLDAGLASYWQHYQQAYQQRMLNKLGFETLDDTIANDLLNLTIQFLETTQASYHRFFAELAEQFTPNWREDVAAIFPDVTIANEEVSNLWGVWKVAYFNALLTLPQDELEQMKHRLHQHNPATVPVRPLIEAAWKSIDEADDWSDFYDLVTQIQA